MTVITNTAAAVMHKNAPEVVTGDVISPVAGTVAEAGAVFTSFCAALTVNVNETSPSSKTTVRTCSPTESLSIVEGIMLMTVLPAFDV